MKEDKRTRQTALEQHQQRKQKIITWDDEPKEKQVDQGKLKMVLDTNETHEAYTELRRRIHKPFITKTGKTITWE